MSDNCELNPQIHYIKKLFHLQDELIDVFDVKETNVNNIKTNETYVSRQKETTHCPHYSSQNYICHSKYTRTLKCLNISDTIL